MREYSCLKDIVSLSSIRQYINFRIFDHSREVYYVFSRLSYDEFCTIKVAIFFKFINARKRKCSHLKLKKKCITELA